MDTIQLLKGVEVFDGLSDAELKRIAGICQEARYQKGDMITTQGETGDEMFIIREASWRLASARRVRRILSGAKRSRRSRTRWSA